ncbi:hypothetical protein [Sphingobacterium luzhongxinii]|uniref:hypothetical protein n=1 Tax=Sphingobacterium luzhongxinii TaxID=2654181 RepID=UPI0013D8FAF9|nr:hypothetical protein [Sphingobacterium sp. xlx-73]
MEIFEPKHFFELAPVLTNVITGLVATLGLYIAFKTFIVAKEAKDEWKRQKTFDIDIDGYASSIDALKLLEDLRLDQYDAEPTKEHSNEILTYIFSKGENDVYKSYIQLYSYSSYYQKMKDRIFDIRKKALIILNISEDQELIDFYDTVLSLEASLFSIHHNYHVSKINGFVDRHQYDAIVKENYAANIYFNDLRKQISQDSASDEELYALLYDRFFGLQNDNDDWLAGLRNKHISFYYKKLKKKNQL